MAPQLNEQQEELLKDLYYTKKFYFGRDKLWKYLKANHPEMKISRRQVMNYLYQQENWQVNLRPQKRVSTKPISVGKVGYLQIDLIDYKGTFVLTVIDVFSKFAGAGVLKNKKETTVYNSLLRILKTFKNYPSVIQADNGTEFNLIEREADSLKIKFLRSKEYTPTSNGLIERWNGTIKRALAKNEGLGDWRLALPKIVEAYNSISHSTIDTTPKDAQEPENQASVKDAIDTGRAKNPTNIKDNLKVGDRVKVVLKKQGLDKKSVNTFTREIYTIFRITKSNRPFALNSYKLKDEDDDLIRGVYNITELKKINVE